MAEQNAKKVTEKVTETINGNLVVVREAINGKDGKPLVTKDGRPYYAYIVRGYIRGQEKKVDFAPSDQGGYEPLDILFDIKPKAELIINDEIMTDEHGRETPYKTYEVQVADEDGEIWKCPVKPQRKSDKSLLDFLFIELRKSLKAQSAA